MSSYPSGREIESECLGPIACWDCGFESRRGHGCLSVECCVLSGRDVCDGPIPHPEESYRLWCVTVCDLQTSRMRRPWPTLGCYARKKCHRKRHTWVRNRKRVTDTVYYKVVIRSFNFHRKYLNSVNTITINRIPSQHSFTLTDKNSYMFQLARVAIIRLNIYKIKKIMIYCCNFYLEVSNFIVGNTK